MRKLGWIGGLGPLATIHYYRELSEANAGEALLIQAEMSHALQFVQRNDRDGLAAYFARLIERLARGGAEIAAISAFTPHICIRELEKISPLPLVNIVTEIRDAILARGYRRVALFGTRYTVQSKLFGMLDGVDVIVPEQVEEIHALYMQTVEGGPDSAAALTRIAQSLPVDAIVLAGTDLSMIFNESNTEFPCIDGARVHIEAILREISRPGAEAR